MAKWWLELDKYQTDLLPRKKTGINLFSNKSRSSYDMSIIKGSSFHLFSLKSHNSPFRQQQEYKFLYQYQHII